MKEAFSFRKFIFALLIGFGGALAAAFLPTMLVPAVAAIGFVGACWGPSYALVAAAFTAGGAVFGHITEPAVFIPYALILVGASAFLGIGLRKKLPYRLIAAVLAVAAFAAVFCLMSLSELLAGREAYSGVISDIEELESLFSVYGGGLLTEELAEVRATVPSVFFGLLIIVSEGAGLAALLLARLFARWGRAELRPMERFRCWQLPHSLKFGLPLLAAGVAALYIAKFAGAQTMLYTVLYLVIPLFGAAGVGTMLFLALRRGRGWAVFAVIICVLAPLFTALIGVADLYAGIRRKLIRVDRLVQEAFERAEKEKRSTVTVDLGDGQGPRVIAVRKQSHEDAFFDDASEKPEDGAESEKAEDDRQKIEENITENDTHPADGEVPGRENNEDGGPEK